MGLERPGWARGGLRAPHTWRGTSTRCSPSSMLWFVMPIPLFNPCLLLPPSITAHRRSGAAQKGHAWARVPCRHA